MKFDRKPPLPKSPTRLRSLRVLRSNSASLQTPTTDSATIIGGLVELKPDYRSMSCELRALSTKLRDELGNLDPETPTLKPSGACHGGSLVHERGRLYDEYSAMRNERLKMKKLGAGSIGAEDFSKTLYGMRVTVKSSERRDSMKKTDSSRKSAVASANSGLKISGGEPPRYLLRSMCKESKHSKPTAIPLPPLGFERSALPCERRIGVRRSVRNVGL